MNFIKKSLLTLGVSAAFTGVFGAMDTVEVEASAWEARTVTEIKEDIEANDTEATYTIKWGDTLGTIATAFELPLNKIAQVNDIANVDYIISGNVLHFSADQKTVSVEDTVTNEVKSYDVSAEQVKEVPVPETVVEVVEEPAPAPAPAPEQPAEPAPAPAPQTNISESEAEAKSWIAYKESTDNYYATNGRYIGKYQLTNTYLNGDYSPENQERVADEYVASRYGSWVNAKQFWLQNGWY